VSIHNQETSFEDELFLQGTGEFLKMYKMMNIDNSHHLPTKRSSLQTYFSHLSKAASVILVHNTFIKQADIDYVKQNRSSKQLISFCLCVNANIYIENTVPPIEMLMQNDCNIIIGTDSIASNWSSNILNEMKTIQKEIPNISLEKILQWATFNGAKALQMDDLGSFEKGKTPGIVLIENVQEMQLKKNSSSKRIL
jgi:cytosine/adenosine deaminase-related metal-dependent hydrolase